MTAWQVLVQGFVQGQGVRPSLARLAAQHGWAGSVRNTPQGVQLVVEAAALTAADLELLIRSAHPALHAAALSVQPVSPAGRLGFCIEESAVDGVSSVPMPHDAAICSDCLGEYHDAANRRWRYGLISCTRCGPRFSIATALPFDRARTTLSAFPLCSDCEREYRTGDNRRSHAQTIGCPNCGPQVWAADRAQRTIAAHDAACHTAAAALRAGRIVALRGIGGYQLLVDAGNDAAVQTLRDRKRRPTKPLAVLCRTVADAEALSVLDDAARKSLLSPANPIVVVPRRPSANLSAGVHPHISDVGVMLPTTALHDRLLELTQRALVCTSGNIEGAPLAVTLDDAQEQLAGIADVWLHHDRPIHQAIDDSVVRPMAGRLVTLRCARGLAPLPLDIPATHPMLALGGFLKAAVAWSNGAQAALGPHVGDLGDLQTRDRWRHTLASVADLYGITHPAWITDAHPDDPSRSAVPAGEQPFQVWHHHAHIAAGMLEQGWLDRPVLGIAADGQGYGPDGTLWGGEVLWTTLHHFRRIACLRPFGLPGGETAVREPGRVAIALLDQLPELSSDAIAHHTRSSLKAVGLLRAALRAAPTPQTTSLGRLFDGVAWLVLPCGEFGYVGEPAARLEALCDRTATGCYEWTIDAGSEPWQLDWRPMLRSVLLDLQRDAAPGVIAERFHRGVAEWMLAIHARFAAPLVAGGGVFQNRRLCELLAERWPRHAAPLGLPGGIPPNDGGLAAGQLAVASAWKPQRQ